MLVSAAGGLTEPKLPDVRGLDSFAGAMLHSARWDHGHDLNGERVGVIGTGSTASQSAENIEFAKRFTEEHRETFDRLAKVGGQCGRAASGPSRTATGGVSELGR